MTGYAEENEMNTYLITAHAKLFSITRVVEAANKVEAAMQVNQTGIVVMWIDVIESD